MTARSRRECGAKRFKWRPQFRLPWDTRGSVELHSPTYTVVFQSQTGPPGWFVVGAGTTTTTYFPRRWMAKRWAEARSVEWECRRQAELREVAR